MIAQTRALLDRYRTNGGEVRELVLEGAGHTPFLEQPDRFREALIAFIG